jgi:hydrophobic/amphiphilic exporter-1 (mainly G- bacteria), HAE1 family
MISWATHRPAVVWASAAALTLAGAVAFSRLPLATRPSVELPRLMVEATWPGAAAELVEAYLTAPIEAAVQTVRGVRKTSSTSDEGRASLRIDLNPHADVQLARLGILERLELLRRDFPPGSSRPQVSNYVPEDLAEQPLLRYTLSGPYTAGTIARAARDLALPRVSAVPGVAGVGVAGGAELGVSVTYDGVRLRRLGLTPEAVVSALQNARLVVALGEERTEGAGVVRPVVLYDHPADLDALSALAIPGPEGRVFRLGEVASVRIQEDARDRFNRVNGAPAVTLTVSRLPGADAIRTAEAVREVMDGVEDLLPPGIRVRLQVDESVNLARQLTSLGVRGAVACLAVMLVLAMTLRNLRAVGLVFGSAVISVAGTALGLYFLKIPANLLTLAGLAMGIGILVQNGAVVVDRLRTAPDTPAGRATAARGIAAAVLGATLTTAVVLLPFLYLQGDARAAFTPFAVAFALALAWSVLASVLMLPAVGAGHRLRAVVWPRPLRAYGRALVFLLRWRLATVVVSAGILVVVAWGFVEKVPRSSWRNWWGSRSTLLATLNFPRGSDPASLDRGMREFERVVVGREGVDQVVTQGGREGARMLVYFARDAEASAIPYILQEEVTGRAILVGGATVGVTYQGPGFYSGGGGGGFNQRIKVLGYSFSGVEQIALDLKSRLERIPRVRDVNANAASFWRQEKAYTVTLAPDRQALARYGLTARDFAGAIGRQVRGPVGGQRLELGGEELPLEVKDAGARDRTLDELRAGLIANPGGAPLRVNDVARVDEREALAMINREDQQYVRVVSYEFRGPQRLAERTHRSFLQSIDVPAGYSVGDDRFDWAGDEGTKGLWLVFALGVVLVLLSVAMVFDSLWAAGMVFLSLPLALAGSAAAFWITGTPFSREAAVGGILVVGLAVNQAILLVDAALARRRAAGEGRRSRPLTGGDVLHAARDRSGMIVLVTLTTLASLIPLAVGTDPDELFGGIALATTGGTVAGTIGAMLILPALLGRWRWPRLRWTGSR